jgi:ATP-dependent Clp protease ATP-binding subunit ClpC
MIRLDMSEFQDIGSISRLVGERHSGAPGGTLVDKIRENPFSVLLLDELEKAHPRVWDLFLQVFDDGRMTDSNGRMADFRHAIIILTSNLGATIANEAGIGFTSTSGGFSAQDVMRVVNRTFRREFLNRLDRVVVFQPLGRKTMRVILQKELEKALGRRGLRSKQWAVEWEDSALEFLLSEGFTPDLGARPLRRAIERHLLAPLSMTMVQNQAPDGEQFLFVRSDGEALSVEFVDPDSELSDDHAPDAVVTDPAAEMSLAALMLSSRVPENATAYLVHQFDEVSARTSGKEWEEAKSAYLNEINSEKFWSRDDRHHVLDRVELIDRLDSAVSVLGKLTRRLKQHPGNRKLIKSVAGRLYVVKEGLEDIDQNRPTQAYLGLRLVSGDVDKEGSEDCLDALEHMYRRWAKDRGMRMIEIDADKSRYAVLFKVSGFGSLGILQRESGLHVFETPKGKSSFDRIRARVEVTGVPVKTPASEVDKAEVATSLLDAAAGPVEIVRRYRRMPSPLVRDSVRNWRSGRLDSVLAGNFDVIGALVTAD